MNIKFEKIQTPICSHWIDVVIIPDLTGKSNSFLVLLWKDTNNAVVTLCMTQFNTGKLLSKKLKPIYVCLWRQFSFGQSQHHSALESLANVFRKETPWIWNSSVEERELVLQSLSTSHITLTLFFNDNLPVVNYMSLVYIELTKKQ